MMHSLKRVGRFICLWIILSRSAAAQDARQTLQYADYLFTQAEYQRAVVHYQRVLFFDAGEINAECFTRIGDCFSAIDSLKKANLYYDLAFHSASDDSLKDDLLLKRAENLIIMKEYKQALQEIYAVDESNSHQHSRVMLYQACVAYGLKEFDRAEKFFFQLCDSINHPVEFSLLKKQFRDLKRVNKLNPNTAMILSMIVPGTGQFYAGDIKNGINSMAITSAFMYFTLRSIVVVGVLEGFTTVFPVYFRYYTGGFKRAKAIAQERKEFKQNRIYYNILDIVDSQKAPH